MCEIPAESGDEQDDHRVGVCVRATDLENFPLRLEIRFGTESHVLQFKDPSFAKLADGHLTPPPKFKRYADLDTLLQSALLRGLGFGAPEK